MSNERIVSREKISELRVSLAMADAANHQAKLYSKDRRRTKPSKDEWYGPIDILNCMSDAYSALPFLLDEIERLQVKCGEQMSKPKPYKIHLRVFSSSGVQEFSGVRYYPCMDAAKDTSWVAKEWPMVTAVELLNVVELPQAWVSSND